MTNDLAITTTDGWNDVAAEANERVLRGTLLKFADSNWARGKEASPIERGTQLVATGTRAAQVRWQDGKPVEWRWQEPGRRLPEREELGDNDPTKWALGPDGKTPRDPWQNTRYIYLLDPDTAEAFTFSTSSWGGREAVINLGDAIARMRMAHPNAMPIVALEAAPMITKYGRRSKPTFKIVGWKATGNEVPELIEPDELPF